MITGKLTKTEFCKLILQIVKQYFAIVKNIPVMLQKQAGIFFWHNQKNNVISPINFDFYEFVLRILCYLCTKIN